MKTARVSPMTSVRVKVSKTLAFDLSDTYHVVETSNMYGTEHCVG